LIQVKVRIASPRDTIGGMIAASRAYGRFRRWAILPAALLCVLLVAAGPAAAHERATPAATVATAAEVQNAISDWVPDEHTACRSGPAQTGHHCSAGASCQAVGLVQDLAIFPDSTGTGLERRSLLMRGGRDIAPLFHPPKSTCA
jgi:hypothetical protein